MSNDKNILQSLFHVKMILKLKINSCVFSTVTLTATSTI